MTSQALLFVLGLAAAGQATRLSESFNDVFLGCLGDETAPEQLHFNYACDHGMMISWNTAAKLQFPTVRYGQGSQLDQISFSQVSVTYSNHVFIDGLEPDTEYSFAVHCADENDRHQFKTSLPAGNPRPYTFAFFGDLGTMGPLGLTDNDQKYALSPDEITTVQSLNKFKDQFEFMWHGQ